MAVLVVVVATPYSILHMGEYRGGPVRQLQQYYPTPAGQIAFGEHLTYFLRTSFKDLGPVLSALFFVGAILLLRRAARQWAPLLVHPLVVHVVMATGSLVFERYILPVLRCRLPGRLCPSRAPGSSLAARSPSPRSSSPSHPVDHLFAIQSLHGPAVCRGPRARLDRDARAGRDPHPGDARSSAAWRHRRRGDRSGSAPLRNGFSFRVPTARTSWLCWRRTSTTSSLAGAVAGAGARCSRRLHRQKAGWANPLQIKVPRPEARPHYEPLDPRHFSVRSSTGSAGIAALLDGDPGTCWSSERGLTTADWLEITLDQAMPVGRVELWLGPGSSEPKLG